MGKYSFVNRTIQHWNQLPAEVLGILPCSPPHKINEISQRIITFTLPKIHLTMPKKKKKKKKNNKRPHTTNTFTNHHVTHNIQNG
jgi:hypothetical protein